MPAVGLPLPPLDLANRVGALNAAPDPFAYYESLGRRTRGDMEAVLPTSWSWAGKRVLDFGCGAGRTLRHFIDEADEGEIWGCDIDAESIGWLQDHASPPFTVFRNREVPPLDVPDGYFDFIWCVSVFTHLTDTWSVWLLELRRVLAPDGMLLVTFMGEGMSQQVTGERWDEDTIGMSVRHRGQSWDVGGPMVLHSPWWIREHWGRAFEVLELLPSGFATQPPHGQGLVLLRQTDADVTAADLERIAPDEPRELAAVTRETRAMADEIVALRAHVAGLEADRDRLMLAHDVIAGSRTWRLTEPLRRAKRAAALLRGRARPG